MKPGIFLGTLNPPSITRLNAIHVNESNSLLIIHCSMLLRLFYVLHPDKPNIL